MSVKLIAARADLAQAAGFVARMVSARPVIPALAGRAVR